MKHIFLSSLLASIFIGVPLASAGKVELTTYYPAPYGEYKEVNVTQKLKVPAKNVVEGTSPLSAGEIWVQDDTQPTAT